MADSEAPRVFISYAWKNQPIARQLQSDLQRDGVEVFVDYEKITGGDSLPERISTALDWCNTLILLWSADSAESYYVKQEWTSAFHLQKRIIACVLDGTALPALLRGRLYLNFSPYETGYGQLCRSLGVEPKVAQPAPVTPSILPPQHVEFPLPETKPLQAEPSKSSPPTESVSAKPAKKPKRWQPLVGKTKVFMPSGSAAARKVSAWWPRGKVMNITFAVIVVAIVYVAFQFIQSSSKPANPRWRFRSEPKTLSVDSVKAMITKYGFYDFNLNKNGNGIAHQYKAKKSWIIFGDAVVIDWATGLTWQQSGSNNYMTYADAAKYVDDLNAKNFASHSDWRLPTLEEAMSLMEPQKYDNLYIDPKFDREQTWIWTADKESAGRAWAVGFRGGLCSRFDVGGSTFVRAVRSGQ